MATVRSVAAAASIRARTLRTLTNSTPSITIVPLGSSKYTSLELERDLDRLDLDLTRFTGVDVLLAKDPSRDMDNDDLDLEVDIEVDGRRAECADLSISSLSPFSFSGVSRSITGLDLAEMDLLRTKPPTRPNRTLKPFFGCGGSMSALGLEFMEARE